MYFTETPSLREIEKAMKMVPNFTPRGHGVVILCKHEFAEKSCIGDSQKEILARTVSRINNPLFQKRFQKYINESETIPVNFRNSKHSTTFTDAIKKKNKRDYVDTVGRNKKVVEKYIRNQLQQDYEEEQLSIKKFISLFTGQPVKEIM